MVENNQDDQIDQRSFFVCICTSEFPGRAWIFIHRKFRMVPAGGPAPMGTVWSRMVISNLFKLQAPPLGAMAHLSTKETPNC